MTDKEQGWLARLFSGGKGAREPFAGALVNIMQSETRGKNEGTKTAQVEGPTGSDENAPVGTGRQEQQWTAVPPADRPQTSISPPSKRSAVLGYAIAAAVVVLVAAAVAGTFLFTSFGQPEASPQARRSDADSATVSPISPRIRNRKSGEAEVSSTATTQPSSKALTEIVEKQSQQAGQVEVFHFQPPNCLELPPGLVSEKIEVRPNGVSRCSIEVLEGGHMAFCGEEIVPDALGSKNIHIIVEPGGGPTSFAGLDFTTSCMLNIWKDGSLEVDNEGIEASDSSGGHYVVQAVTQDGKRSMLMVRRREGLERLGEPPVKRAQAPLGFETENGNPVGPPLQAAGARLPKSTKRILGVQGPRSPKKNIEMRPSNGGRTLVANEALYSVNVADFHYRVAPGSFGNANVDLDVWGVIAAGGGLGAITWSGTPLSYTAPKEAK